MQIDRARFLLLTASLAGAAGPGCSANSPEGPATPAPSTSTTATDPGALTSAPEPDPTSTDPVVAIPTSAPTVDPVTTAEPVTTSQPSSGTCDNDTGTIPACSIAGPPGPFCEGLTDAKAACKGYKAALRPAIAAKAVACLNAGSGKQAICDYQLLEACSTASIRTACINPSTATSCNNVVAACSGNQWGKITMNDCQSLLSAVKDGKKQSMVTCMMEGCSLDSCTWMLR